MFGKYLLATKPWLVAANVLSAAAGYLFAAGGHAAGWPFVAAMAGITLFVAAGCVCNNLIDRDLDRAMDRTRGRVLATGRLSGRDGLRLALGLMAAGAALLLAGANLLSLGVVAAGFAVYVGVYSAWLKRRSPYATVVGSLAGAAPPVAGACAASGAFDGRAVVLLALFSLWQIPHSYAIALYRLDDYAAAGVPVMPVARGVAATKRLLAGHILAFGLASLVPWLLGYAGRAYLAVAVALSLGWLSLAAWGDTGPDDRRQARRLYLFSILVVCGLSLMLAADATP
ncbi:MAG: heme o synthase [Solidesulfovibrio sp.]|uniref:heme o synthase n=1 Tax=Solidesulfovibrio sp. TaxID=2910990 RepID=UPI0031583AE5